MEGFSPFEAGGLASAALESHASKAVAKYNAAVSLTEIMFRPSSRGSPS
jgi:hypothetical protein